MNQPWIPHPDPPYKFIVDHFLNEKADGSVDKESACNAGDTRDAG